MESVSTVGPIAEPKKTRKKFKWSVVIWIGFVMAAFILGRKFGAYKCVIEPMREIYEDIAQSPTSAPKSPQPTYTSQTTVSPDKRYAVTVMVKTTEEKYELTASLVGLYDWSLGVVVDGKEMEERVFASWTWTNKEKYAPKVKDLSYEFHRRVAWTPDGRFFALALDESIDIFEIVAESVITINLRDNHFSEKPQVVLARRESLSPDPAFDEYDSPSMMMFSADHQLYLTDYVNPTQFRVIYPETSVIEAPGLYNARQLYFLPGTPGYAYIANQQKEPWYIAVSNGSTETKYFLDKSIDFDAAYNIQFSPDLEMACVDFGASGGRWQSVIELKTGEEIEAGYGCQRWLNNDELVVCNDYGSIDTCHLVNLATSEKTLLL